MKFTDETRTKIIAALAERLPEKQLGECSICSKIAWAVLPLFVPLSATTDLRSEDIGEEMPGIKIGKYDKTIPCAVLTCINCGNTRLLNLNVLGLKELYAPRASDEQSETAKTAKSS
jgi:hypothetical protein